MSKVDLTLIQAPPQKLLIEHLEDLMEKAKSGDLQGIAYATIYRGNFVESGFSALPCYTSVIGELFKLQHKIAQGSI